MIVGVFVKKFVGGDIVILHNKKKKIFQIKW